MYEEIIKKKSRMLPARLCTFLPIRRFLFYFCALLLLALHLWVCKYLNNDKINQESLCNAPPNLISTKSEQEIVHPEQLELEPAHITGVDTILVIAPKDKAHPRYTFLKKNEERANLTFNYIDQIGKDSDQVQLLTKISPDSALSAGQRAVYASHIKMWKLIIEKNFQAALILEDDIEVDLDLKQKVEQAYRELNGTWPYLTLLGYCFEENLVLTPGSLLGDLEKFSCTHAYIITIEGAYKFLRYLEYDPLDMDFAVDVAMRELAKSRKFLVKAFSPPLVRQLPRIMFSGETITVTGPGRHELPMHDLQNPALFSNEEFWQIISHNHPQYKAAETDKASESTVPM